MIHRNDDASVILAFGNLNTLDALRVTPDGFHENSQASPKERSPFNAIEGNNQKTATHQSDNHTTRLVFCRNIQMCLLINAGGAHPSHGSNRYAPPHGPSAFCLDYNR